MSMFTNYHFFGLRASLACLHGCLALREVGPAKYFRTWNRPQNERRAEGFATHSCQPVAVLGRPPRRTPRGDPPAKKAACANSAAHPRNRTTREQKSRVGWLPTCAEAMLQKPVYQAGGAQPAAAQSRKAAVAVVGGGGGSRGAVWRWTGRRACKRHS